jgi:Nuclear protein Es2
MCLTAGLVAAPRFGTGGQPRHAMRPWKHVPKNALYYYPSQRDPVPLTAAERSQMVAGAPKQIAHR